ncbi:short chain dehydrogenase [Fusarium pseudocircinatum]|uniref:Short chain dehydrogenase n=1 Tax=Fusarium pseudocircinatum TaxID=56676 RepID=A0A8H5PZ62_9HYPO|nr:short chain dehydrogenase [Fusarium pseudocircinatum]
MNASLYQSLVPHTFDLLADSFAQLTRIDYFHHVGAFQKETITILSIFGTVKFLKWAIVISFFFHTYCLHRSKIHRYNHVSPDGSAAWALVTGACDARRRSNCAWEQKLLLQTELRELEMERKLDLEAIKNELSKLNLTVLVNCANGEARHTDLKRILDENEKPIWKHVNSDALYPIQLFRALLPTLIGNSPSLIINVTSLSDKGFPLKIATSASRSFLSRMTQSSALEMKLEGYDIEALCVRVSRRMGQTDSTLARAIIARVGSRRSVVVGHWYQYLHKGLVDRLPGWLWDWCIIHYIRGKRDDISKGS